MHTLVAYTGYSVRTTHMGSNETASSAQRCHHYHHCPEVAIRLVDHQRPSNQKQNQTQEDYNLLYLLQHSTWLRSCFCAVISNMLQHDVCQPLDVNCEQPARARCVHSQCVVGHTHITIGHSRWHERWWQSVYVCLLCIAIMVWHLWQGSLVCPVFWPKNM